mmetsp:Transcript_16148/g.46364  ORF Transcript_16148/g.46364 Transcript_16148/m.46364 type:complete len:424 (+) Transcript_16148:89-1360(+)
MRRRYLTTLAAAATLSSAAAAAISNEGGGSIGTVPGQSSPSPAQIHTQGSSSIARRKKRRSSMRKRPTSASFPAPVSSTSASKNEAAPRDVQQASSTPPTTGAGNDDKISGASASAPLTHTPDRPNKCMDPYLASTTPWVRRYLASAADDVLLPVPREFLTDGFNLQGLQQSVEQIGQRAAAGVKLDDTVAEGDIAPTGDSQETKKQLLFPLYRAALKLILSKKEDGEDDENLDVGVAAAAKALYALIHARFCVSPRGLDTLRRLISRSQSQTKMAQRDECDEPVFGRCPRIGCDGMPLLPCGMSDEYTDTNPYKNDSNRRAMRYCISCGEMLMPSKPSKVDGSAWGTSLCHLIIMTYGAAIFPQHFDRGNRKTSGLRSDLDASDESPRRTIGGYSPVPQIFGFPVHETKAAIKYPLLLQKKN